MDLSEVDKIIEALEKKKSLRPGSPPEVLNGHLGVWRTVRHNRVFLELTHGGKTLGRVLIGPPSLVGRTLSDVPSDVWEAMTPRATLKEFRNFKPASSGINDLKEAIKTSVGPKDTRREALNGLETVEQLVPIARSAGFTDAEIKQSLKGNPPNVDLKSVPERRDATDDVSPDSTQNAKPDNVVPILGLNKPPSGAPTGSTQNIGELEGALARLPEQATGAGGNKPKKVAEFLEEKISPNIKNDDLLKQRVNDLASGLRAGKYSVREVEDEIREIIKNRSRVASNALKPVERQALNDSVKVKDFIDNFDTKVEEKINEKIDERSKEFKPKETQSEEGNKPEVADNKVKQLAEELRRQGEKNVQESEKQRAEMQRLREQASRERQRAQEFMSAAQKARMEVEAALSVLRDLAISLENKEIRKELTYIVDHVSKGNYSRKSILLRLYQLLQLLLLFIPGL